MNGIDMKMRNLIEMCMNFFMFSRNTTIQKQTFFMIDNAENLYYEFFKLKRLKYSREILLKQKHY